MTDLIQEFYFLNLLSKPDYVTFANYSFVDIRFTEIPPVVTKIWCKFLSNSSPYMLIRDNASLGCNKRNP